MFQNLGMLILRSKKEEEGPLDYNTSKCHIKWLLKFLQVDNLEGGK